MGVSILRLTQFWKDGYPALGLLCDNGLIDVQAEAAVKGISAPVTMLDLIHAGAAGLDVLRELEMDVSYITDYSLAPVVTGSDKILCIGLNYRQHAAECKLPIPPAPVLFNKFANALSADGDSVKLLSDYLEYDYEAELVAIIGTECKDVSAEDALGYVFGYTCGNDLSTRDLQFARGNQWILSKSLDGFAPIGPCVVTADCLDPQNLAISSRVNGELRQNSNTSDMIFSVAQIISDLSHHMTLRPGDLIFTGTPQGVMHGYPADQKNWLKSGDHVEIIIEGIGSLHTNLV